MAVFEIQAPDGQRYEVSAPSREAAVAALRERGMIGSNKPDDLVFNPHTGQMTTPELLRNYYRQNGISGAEAAIAGAARGGTFAFSDEIGAATNATIPGRGTARERFDFGLAAARAFEDAAREERPGTFLASEIAAALGTAAVTAPLAAARTGLGVVGRGAALGAGEGFAYGVGRGEGAERLETGAQDAIVGGLLGAAAPVVVGAAKKGVDAVRGAAGSVTGRASPTRARSVIADTIRRSGRSVDDIADDVANARALGQEDFRAVDAMGDAGARRLGALARSNDDVSSEIVEFLERRQAGQGARVAGAVEDAFETGGDTAAARRTTLDAARTEAANVNYGAARADARPVNLNDAIDKIDELMNRNPILGDSALTQSEIGRRLMAIRGRLQKGGEQLIDFDQVLNAKQDLGAEIARIQRRGEKVPPQLAAVYRELDQALEASSDAYRLANDEFRRASGVIDAVDEGQNMARPGARAGDTVPRIQSMTDEQRAAARVGYAERPLARIEANTSPTANMAKYFDSDKVRAETGAMLVNPDRFQRQITNEMAMWNTQNKAVRGSPTARNLADDAALGDAVMNIGQGVRAAGNLQFGDAAAAILRPVLDAAQGLNDATRREIARALLSDNPREAMNVALRAEMGSEARRRLIEAIGRASGLRAISSQ